MKNILFAIILFATPLLTLAQCSVSLQSTATIGCHGSCTGALSAVITSGTAPYTYSWSSSIAMDSFITNLCEGTYTVSTTDFFGCTATDTYIFSGAPQAIGVNAVVLPTSCAGNCDGDISMSVSGGTGPYTYSWFYGDVTEDLHGICPGTYCETISDSIGCSLDTCYNVTEPSSIQVGVNVQNVSCPGGSDGFISLDVYGGKHPYSYLWFSTGDTTYQSSNLTGGTYCYQVTDSTGCGSSDCIEVSEPSLYSISAIITEPKCYGGSDGCLTLSISGGTSPYTYLWNSGATTKDLCPVPSTFYSVQITDTLGCMTDTSFTVDQPPFLSITLTGYDITCTGCNNGVIDVAVVGGTPSYQYSWNPNVGTGSSVNGLAAGLYSVCVNDLNNCSACDTVTIFDYPTFIHAGGENSLIKIYPNPVAGGVLRVSGNELWGNSTLEIANVLGENVFNYKLQILNFKPQTSIDVSSFNKGIYFVKVICEEGDVIDARKIVIE